MDHEQSLDALHRAEQVNAESRTVEIDAGVVTRPASPVSATVHAYLTYLRDQGLACVQRPLDVTDDLERLEFLAGDSGGDAWQHQHTDEGLASAARLLRLLHDAGRNWVPPSDATWGMAPVPGEDLVFAHGDPGPWNFVWRDREAIGLLDWDFLHPAPRADDVAYALRWFVPLRSDEMARDWHHFPQVPDRRHRIGVFLDAYGPSAGLEPSEVADAAVRRIQVSSDLVRSLAEQGLEPQRTWVAEGSLDVDRAEIDWIRSHRDEFS